METIPHGAHGDAVPVYLLAMRRHDVVLLPANVLRMLIQLIGPRGLRVLRMRPPASAPVRTCRCDVECDVGCDVGRDVDLI